MVEDDLEADIEGGISRLTASIQGTEVETRERKSREKIVETEMSKRERVSERRLVKEERYQGARLERSRWWNQLHLPGC